MDAPGLAAGREREGLAVAGERSCAVSTWLQCPARWSDPACCVEAEEGDVEEAFVDAAGTAAEGLVVGPDRGSGAAPDPGGDDEEYYDDEGADNDREDDEE